MSKSSIMKFVKFIIVIAVISGCAAAPRQTVEEMRDLRKKRIEAATRTFKNVNREDVENSIVEVFNLFDRKDVNFDVRDDKLLVSRYWTFYMIFSAGFGKDFWEFYIREVENGIEVTAAFDSESNTGMFPSNVSTEFKENIGIGGSARTGASIADYDLLYGRIEYILGIKKTWPTCDIVAKRHNVHKRTMVMCDGFGIEDRLPKDYQ
jgi:hypothetical protein